MPTRRSSRSRVRSSATPAGDAFLAASATFRSRDGDGSPTTQVGEEALADAAVASDVAPRHPRRPRKILAASATVGVMAIAGLLAVSMTLPAEAIAVAQGATPGASSLVASGAAVAGGSKIADDEIQVFVSSADVQKESFDSASGFSSMSLVDLAAESGIHYSDSLYTNDRDAAIQWPFAVGVAMSSGYGQRWGRLHAGIDMVPGDGAPIQSIADGTVRIATEAGGGYGVTAYIDHVIDGKVVTSHYSHMQYGSLRVKAGDKVKVGDIIGLVGNTGRSYGAHLHFELIANGSTFDPLPWLKENAGRYDGVTPVS